MTRGAMRRAWWAAVAAVLAGGVAAGGRCAEAAETVWIEAEHLGGVRGYCWPMGRPDMKKTDGHWGLSGPGWAAEWNQGGESGFLSIATGADDDRASAGKSVEIPADGQYVVWVRYGDWREKPEPFQVRIDQPGRPTWTGHYGQQAVIEEDNEMKLYFGWAFGWARHEAELKKGTAQLALLSTSKAPEPRQVDCIVLTTDAAYRPVIKERPARHDWRLLEAWRPGLPDDLEPLARKQPSFDLPQAWKLRTFRDGDFLYLWNVSHTPPAETWLSEKPERVKFPYNIIDAKTREEFEKKYGGRDDVPIFSDQRIVPTFHGVGAGVFHTDAQTGEVNPTGQLFARWLQQNPERPWAMMMNYHGGQPIGEKGVELFKKYRQRYVGSISGESLGYFYPKPEAIRAATSGAQTRRQLVEAFTPLSLAENREKYRQVYGKDLDANPYEDVIACLSVGNIAFMPLCYDWGARTVGYESATATSSVLPMRWAFMRGAARQWNGLTATYRSCNFGDSATIFSNAGSFHSPQNILDNYYSVYSGAGMTWYKMDIWYQYMAGSAMFYHEQGFDEFWQPGGTSAAGVHEVQLSPKGKLVDRFLRVTAGDFDRGHPYTPVAFLVDYAHGWEPAPFWPNSFKNWHQHQERFLYGDHEKMLEEYFWTAWHPIGRESEKPITGTNEVYLAGVFGDIFDVVFAYPDVQKWRSIDSYPVVIVAGDIELTEPEGRRLAEYINQGGTLLVADAQLSGPGAATLALPATGEAAEAAGYRWLLEGGDGPAAREDSAGGSEGGEAAHAHPSQQYRYRPVEAADGLRPLATTPEGRAFCVAADRGQGRLVYLTVPRGLGIDRQAHPAVARLFAHLSRGLMPLEVRGDVEWLVNRTGKGWMVTLMNPAGQLKPQQGIFPTDYRQNRAVTIQCGVPVKRARDRLLADEPLEVKENRVEVVVPAGGVRIIELTD